MWQVLLAALRTCDRLVPDADRATFQRYVRSWPARRWPGSGGHPCPTRATCAASCAASWCGPWPARRGRRRRRARPASCSPRAPATPPVLAACTAVVAATGDADDYERFLQGFRTSATPQEGLRFLYGLAEFGDPELFDRTLAFALSGEVRTQNAPFVLNRCLAHREHGERAWRFVRQHWDDANRLFPNNLVVRMVDPVKLLMRPEQQAEVAAFFAEHPIPQSAKTLAQILERQQINVALAQRDGGPLGAGIAALAG